MSEDGDAYTLDFEPGLTDKELDSLRTKFPSNTIAGELIEILRETRGFPLYALEPAYFDSIDEFGNIELIPHSITLGDDGLGNFWVLDIKENGALGKVYYACHDPAVLLIYCDTLNEFFASLYEFYNNPRNNYLNTVHDDVVWDIDSTNPNVTEISEFRSNNDNLTPFLSEFVDDNWVVADLRKGTHKTGFAWGKFELNQYTRRHPDELVWIIQKKRRGCYPGYSGVKVIICTL